MCVCDNACSFFFCLTYVNPLIKSCRLYNQVILLIMLNLYGNVRRWFGLTLKRDCRYCFYNWISEVVVNPFFCIFFVFFYALLLLRVKCQEPEEMMILLIAEIKRWLNCTVAWRCNEVVKIIWCGGIWDCNEFDVGGGKLK